MKTADMIRVMVLAADARLAAIMREWSKQFLDPLQRQVIAIMERQLLRERIGKLLRVNEQW